MNPEEQPVEYREPSPGEQGQQQAAAQSAAQKSQEILFSDRTNFAKYILEDHSIPEQARRDFPVYADKEFSLTNIQSEEQLKKFMIKFRISELDYLDYAPHFKTQASDIKNMQQLEAKFRAKLQRATGGKLRERALFQTVISAQEKEQPQQASGGVLSRLKEKMI